MESIDNNYQTRTYEELSQEFKQLYATAIRALNLIPIMYNRLTIVDKLTHKAAVTKIREDHKDLPGFSGRNIRRYIPTDNPSIPRRIRPPRPKIGPTGIGSQGKLNNTTNESKPKENVLSAPLGSVTSNRCPDCERSKEKIEELEEALEKASAPAPASTIIPAYYIPKERLQEIILAAENCHEIVYLHFNIDRYFIRAENDTGKQNLLPGEEMAV